LAPETRERQKGGFPSEVLGKKITRGNPSKPKKKEKDNNTGKKQN